MKRKITRATPNGDVRVYWKFADGRMLLIYTRRHDERIAHDEG